MSRDIVSLSYLDLKYKGWESRASSLEHCSTTGLQFRIHMGWRAGLRDNMLYKRLWELTQ